MIFRSSVLSLKCTISNSSLIFDEARKILQNQDKPSMTQEIHHIGHLDNLEVETVHSTHSSVGFLGFMSFF